LKQELANEVIICSKCAILDLKVASINITAQIGKKRSVYDSCCLLWSPYV